MCATWAMTPRSIICRRNRSSCDFSITRRAATRGSASSSTTRPTGPESGLTAGRRRRRRNVQGKETEGDSAMRRFIWIAVLASPPLVACPLLVGAAEELDWAYPVTPRPEPLDNLALKQVPGSTRAYTQAQIDDPFNPPDWFPDEHPPQPPIVAQGNKPGVRACAQCHLPIGDGHPESASLAGLPVP